MHIFIFSVHSQNIFEISTVGNVPEPTIKLELVENSANCERAIEFSHVTDNIRKPSFAEECSDSSLSTEYIRKFN